MKDKCDKCGQSFVGGSNTICPNCRYDWADPYDNDQFYQKLWDAGLDINLPKDFDANDYYNAGVIKKDDLINGAYYQGNCRNSNVAMWNAKDNCFVYMRTKFTNVYKDKINHIADDNGFDLFMPFQKIDNVVLSS